MALYNQIADEQLMAFAEDILWFKPIELRTKYGLKGHIREPLGEYPSPIVIHIHRSSQA